VSVGDRGEHIYYDALRGPRTVIKFPGIGHPVPDLELPTIITNMAIENKGPCRGVDLSFVGKPGLFQHRTKECLIYSFIKKEFEEFRNAPIFEMIKTNFREILQDMGAGLGVDVLHCPPHC
jgi:hypothetical protein